VKSYLITDPAYYGSDPQMLSDFLDKVFQTHRVDYALFRDKETNNYGELAQIFIRKCREYGVEKVLLHGDALMAHRYGADGVHLMSHQHIGITEAKSMGLYVILSTHTHMAAMMAKQSGADAITYSPIFDSPGKGDPKGLEDLKELIAKINIPVFALGGILTEDQIQQVAECGAYGFASIRYFVS